MAISHRQLHYQTICSFPEEDAERGAVRQLFTIKTQNMAFLRIVMEADRIRHRYRQSAAVVMEGEKLYPGRPRTIPVWQYTGLQTAHAGFLQSSHHFFLYLEIHFSVFPESGKSDGLQYSSA